MQVQKMESIGTLAGGIAHDFNNLLTVISGFVELTLMRMGPEDPTRDNIVSVLEASKRAQILTSQLLAFSRKQVYQPEIVEINKVISSMEKMIRRLIGEDIHIETHMAENLPPVKADVSQMEQIFLNLAVNARDALNVVEKPDFQKRITIETGKTVLDSEYVAKHPGSNPGLYAYFAVSDNGVGMDGEVRRKIFEPFFTTKEKHKGTGLGLSTVYGIVKQNNGFIYVYSEPDNGTMFKIYWPVSEEKQEVTKRHSFQDEAFEGTESILIVEDEVDVCRFAKKALESLRYKVYSANNGREALDFLKQDLKVDLIITDLIMPEMNGRKFVEKAKGFYPEGKVIYVSGYTDDHLTHNGMLGKEINFIHKPYSIRQLSSVVRKVLNEN
jgi:CheY-like chemotaxis protein